jgi:hypothetical protein
MRSSETSGFLRTTRRYKPEHCTVHICLLFKPQDKETDEAFEETV